MYETDIKTNFLLLILLLAEGSVGHSTYFFFYCWTVYHHGIYN